MQMERVFCFFKMTYTVYILHSEKLNRYYTGYTTNLDVRMALHNNPAAGKFTAKADDWELVFEISCKDQTQALAIEKHIKLMKSKVYIENLIKYPEITEKLKNKYSSNSSEN